MVSDCFRVRATVLLLLLFKGGATSTSGSGTTKTPCSATLQSTLDAAGNTCVAQFSTSNCGPATCQCNAYAKQVACMKQAKADPKNAACDMTKINGGQYSGLQGVQKSQLEWKCAEVLAREAASKSCGSSYKIADCTSKITATKGSCKYNTQALACYDAKECASNTNADFKQAKATYKTYKERTCTTTAAAAATTAAAAASTAAAAASTAAAATSTAAAATGSGSGSASDTKTQAPAAPVSGSTNPSILAPLLVAVFASTFCVSL